MSQSAVLVATLAAAFVLFVAARGRLSAYSAVFFGHAPADPGAAGGSGSGSSGSSGSWIDKASTAADVASFVFG